MCCFRCASLTRVTPLTISVRSLPGSPAASLSSRAEIERASWRRSSRWREGRAVSFWHSGRPAVSMLNEFTVLAMSVSIFFGFPAGTFRGGKPKAKMLREVRYVGKKVRVAVWKMRRKLCLDEERTKITMHAGGKFVSFHF